MKKPAVVYLLCLLHLFLGLNGLVVGILLVLQPDGSLVGLSLNLLSHTAFSDFLVPGIMLLIFCGLLPLITLTGLLLQPSWRVTERLNIYRDRHWAWAWSLYTGITVIAWIGFQMLLLQYYFWLQAVIIFIGLLILTGTLLPTVMNFYRQIDLRKRY